MSEQGLPASTGKPFPFLSITEQKGIVIQPTCAQRHAHGAVAWGRPHTYAPDYSATCGQSAWDHICSGELWDGSWVTVPSPVATEAGARVTALCNLVG